jgi:catechol 2,3-dioxygenase-like lactoylglutathione lyase family enzyme
MTMPTWPPAITAITLFVDSLADAKDFYRNVFGLPWMYEDDVSAVFTIGDMMVNLLQTDQADELVAPAPVGDANAGRRFQLTITVEDVDAACAELTSRGVIFLNGPLDRPWGIRTATFADPSGHVWELAR